METKYEITNCVRAKLLVFCVQCTALDGKCSISCDNQVRKVPDFVVFSSCSDPFALTVQPFYPFGRISTATSSTTTVSSSSQRSNLR